MPKPKSTTLGAILLTGYRHFGNENVIKYWVLVIGYCQETLMNTLQVAQLVIKNI